LPFTAVTAASQQRLLPVNPKISSRNSKHWKAEGSEVFDTNPEFGFFEWLLVA